MERTTGAQLREQFLGWQCRIRQIAVRREQGRPSSGMSPRVLSPAGTELSSAMTVLIIPSAPEESTTYFRFQVRKSNDPKEVYEKGLQYLQATHFHQTTNFSDRMTALFNAGSPLGTALIEAGECLFEFEQFAQSFRMFCAVDRLVPEDEAFQATLWHNRLFNPGLPDDVMILSFTPDWSSAQANSIN